MKIDLTSRLKIEQKSQINVLQFWSENLANADVVINKPHAFKNKIFQPMPLKCQKFGILVSLSPLYNKNCWRKLPQQTLKDTAVAN